MFAAIIIFLILCLLAVLVSHLYFTNDFKKANLPGPRPLPFIGSGHLFLGSSLKFLQTVTDLFNQYGDIFQVYIMNTRFILMNKPQHVEAVVSTTEFISKSQPYIYLQPWLGQGLLTASGHRWHSHRKFLTSAFHFNILKTFLPIFLKNDEILLKKLNAIADGSPVNIFPLMALLALDNVSEAAMGVSVNAQSDVDSKYVAAVNEISEVIFKRMRHPVFRVDAIFNLSQDKVKHDKALALLHGYTRGVIEKRKQLLEKSETNLESYETDFGIKKKSAFLDLLLLSEVDGKKLDIDTVREEVDTFMFEGHDTTTSALSFTLYCISKHQKIQEDLYKEQEHIFGDDMRSHPTFNELSAMKNLDLVIKESIRLFPSVPFIGRSVTRDTKIGDIVVPKGSCFLICILQMHQNPDVFEDPLTFRPERFLNLSTDQKSAYNWIAFSAGPRNCIGQKFAMLELKVVLSSIIRHFHVLDSGIEPQLTADLILRSENGVHVKLKPRSKLAI